MHPTNQDDLLFDDRAILEAALGKNALIISVIRADCDCDAYYNSPDNEDFSSSQSPAAVAAPH